MLVATLALIGCQTSGPVQSTAQGRWISVQQGEDGWLQEKARVCIRSAAGQPMECSTETDPWINALRAAAVEGMEVAAYASERECTRTQTARLAGRGQLATIRLDRIECRKVEGASTRGNGWQAAGHVEICPDEGRCLVTPKDHPLAQAASGVQVLIRAGLNVPTYQHRETCEETLSHVITQHLAGYSKGDMTVLEQTIRGVPEEEIDAQGEGRHQERLARAKTDPASVIYELNEEAKPAPKMTAKVRCRRYGR